MAITTIFLLLGGFGSVLSHRHWHPSVDEWNVLNNANNIGHLPVHEKCLAFFKEYSTYAGEFSRCELQYAEPFRMCNKCVEKYAITLSTYKDLVTNPDLEECRIKYMKSDRVQIFPIVQNNIEDIWTEAACAGCFEDLSINHTTKKVHYHHPDSIEKFMELYHNLSICLNTTLDDHEVPLNGYERIDVCSACQENYTALNHHYNAMSGQFDEDICMDIVDRMNYTRLIWSSHFNCSCHSGEPAAIIVIAVFVASAPVFFYVILRVTGKDKKKKILKQKRLSASARANTSDSLHQTLWRPNNYRNYHSLATT